MSGFKDHFSARAEEYSQFRPRWPAHLFAWLALQVDRTDLAWDCATGSGQAAEALSRNFSRVIATDASSNQISRAARLGNVEYRVEPAERCSLKNESTDLVFVGQAFHWFDHQAFLDEAGRVLRPGGVLAIGSYRLLRVSPAVDKIVLRLWGQILKDWWPSERSLVDQGMGDIVLPYQALPAPEFEISSEWDRSGLLNYLGTWSAVTRYRNAMDADPLALIFEDLELAWGYAGEKRKISWPIELSVRSKPG
jgi:SAM-dependent methyltransferase